MDFLRDHHLEGNMGRTVMPYSHVLGQEQGRWQDSSRGLGKEDQQVFDRLFDRAKFHTAAGAYMAYPNPLGIILLSIILEHEKMLGDILGKFKKGDSPHVWLGFP
jgi:hypothetical protein